MIYTSYRFILLFIYNTKFNIAIKNEKYTFDHWVIYSSRRTWIDSHSNYNLNDSLKIFDYVFYSKRVSCLFPLHVFFSLFLLLLLLKSNYFYFFSVKVFICSQTRTIYCHWITIKSQNIFNWHLFNTVKLLWLECRDTFIKIYFVLKSAGRILFTYAVHFELIQFLILGYCVFWSKIDSQLNNFI